jgi:cobalt/nickel transport system permease protein
VRYADVITGEMRRMKIARESRAFEGNARAQLSVVATSAGALFIRSYERGERVHLAMLSRGYGGSLPVLEVQQTQALHWAGAAVLPLSALAVSIVAWMSM